MCILLAVSVGVTIIGAIALAESLQAKHRTRRRLLADIAEQNRLSRLEWEARQKRINSCC